MLKTIGESVTLVVRHRVELTPLTSTRPDCFADFVGSRFDSLTGKYFVFAGDEGIGQEYFTLPACAGRQNFTTLPRRQAFLVNSKSCLPPPVFDSLTGKYFVFAGDEGIEPPPAVLETAVLPLN